MNRVASQSLVLLATLFSSIAIACSACKRDIVSAAEFDEGSWSEAAIVFVATITSAKLDADGEEWGTRNVEYEYQVEEILKGHPKNGVRLYSSRAVSQWPGELEMITCGDVVIGPGDRVLVFSDGSSSIYFGRCSASRVVDLSSHESRETIERLRSWRK